jgi:hypothetical protein
MVRRRRTSPAVRETVLRPARAWSRPGDGDAAGTTSGPQQQPWRLCPDTRGGATMRWKGKPLRAGSRPPPSWRDGRKPYAALVVTVEAGAGVAAAGQLDPKQRDDRRMFHNVSPVGATSAPLTGLHLVSFVRHNGFNSARGIWTPLPARTRVRQPRESDARRFHKRRRRCAGVTRCGRRLEPEAPWTERTLCAWRALSTREGAAAARPGFRGRSERAV